MGFTDLFGGESKSQREQHQSESGWDSGRYRQFLNDINSTIGGPLSIGDFLRLAPRTQSLFGGDNPMLAGQNRPGGGVNLGFGPPPGYAGSPGVTGRTPAP